MGSGINFLSWNLPDLTCSAVSWHLSDADYGSANLLGLLGALRETIMGKAFSIVPCTQ